jgi:DNA repair protein RecN (Recombination protein N)
MLTHLQIRDLAVVATLDLNFGHGLTVLTGETGAGKSILLTALGLALGDRADSGFIRPGAPRTEVSLEFDLSDAPEARAWMEENHLWDEDDPGCLIRRTVAQDGRSKAFINNRPVTLQSLQELSSGLMEIHGQHAHVKLLQGNEQRRLLDEAAGHAELTEAVAGLYRRWQELRGELERLSGRGGDQAARAELLRYQIDELEIQRVETLDSAALTEEHARLANLGRILAEGQSQLESLYEDERHSAAALVRQAVHALHELARFDPPLAEIAALLGEAQIHIKEASQTLRRRLEDMVSDPARLEEIEQRLGVLHALARKHQVKPEGLVERLRELRAELAGLEGRAERIDHLQCELAHAEEAYHDAAARLSASRRACAARVGAQISAMIHELGMPQGRFLVEVAPQDDPTPRSSGQDRIEFLVSANPGLPPRPLNKVASGGELSRISLAIQVATIHSKSTPTLIFDEVDSGIGGGVAEIVGQRLRALGADRQVFCVTHLPQVAAQGHQHLRVEKSSRDGMTESSVCELGGAERCQEIARMLGGVRITEQTLAHAREMLEGAGKSD